MTSADDPLTPPRSSRTRAYVAAFAVMAVVLVIGSWLVGGSSPFAAGAATGHYEERKAQVEQMLDTHPYGYKRAFVEESLQSLYERADAQLARERPDSRILQQVTAEIDAVISYVEGARAEWAVEFAVKEENRTNVSGSEAEAALDRISGGVSAFEVAEECPERSIACAKRGTSTVVVPSRYAELTDEQLLEEEWTTWSRVMTHEYMHVLQSKLGDQLLHDETYRHLFDIVPDGAEEYDVVDWAAELSADCMAAAVYEKSDSWDFYASAYPGFCSDEQDEFARWIIDEALAAD